MIAPNAHPARNWTRTAVFVIGALQTALILTVLVLFAPGLWAAESLGDNIAVYALLMFCGPYLVCTVPALIMAKGNRYPAIALALCVLSVVATAVLWGA
jgi:hypothetical protein